MVRQMKRLSFRRPRRPRVRSCAIGVVLVAGLLFPLAGHASIPGDFCAAPSAVKGMGSYMQSNIWSTNLIPAYEARCPAGRNLITYDSVGDAAAIEAAISHDFGDPFDPTLMYATDLPMTSSEYYQAFSDVRNAFRPAPGNFINHFPTFVYGVAIGYNLREICPSDQPLKLSARQLSLIYSGLITLWNDPLLVLGEPNDLTDDNTFLGNCPWSIHVAIRQDEASTTLIFKDYLSRDNATFNVYKQKELNTFWPSLLTPVKGYGDTGISNRLDISGTIGYVNYQEARSQTYQIAQVNNAAKVFVAPATSITPGSRTPYPDECANAAESVVVANTTQDWSRVSITTTATGYPICSFSYLLVYQRLYEAYQRVTASTQMRAVSDFLTVMAEDATQDGLRSTGVAPLGPAMRATVRNGISLLSY
jgi:ABC-type phosphate transport system substrate-binding protein